MYRREPVREPTMTGSRGSVILGILLVLAFCILPVQALDNPVPVITKISPTYSDAGISSVTITVTGSSFLSGSVVQWDGVAKPTTYVSATKLTVKIPGDDLKYPKTAKIRVVNPAPGGGTSKELSFTVKAAYWIKSIWPAVVELDPVTLKIKGPNSYWEVNKANADPLADYIFGLGVTGSPTSPQVYFLDAQTKFPSSSTKNSIWQLDMATGRSTKVQGLPKFAMGLGVPSPTKANLFYYAEGKNLHVIDNGVDVQILALPINIGGIDVVPEADTPFLLAISRDPGNQKVYWVNLDANGRFVPPYTQPITIKATPTSVLYPYAYTGIAYARLTIGDVERRVLYVTKDDGTIEPWDRIGIVDFNTGDILAAAFTNDLGIEVDSSTAWQSGTSGYLNYANPSGIDFIGGRLFVSSLHYWNKGDKWPPLPEGKCISGKKYEDKDGSGHWDTGEPFLAGWKIQIYRWDGTTWVYMRETTTDQNGAYQFCNLPPCTQYKLTETQQSGYVQTEPASGYHVVYLPVCTNQYDKNFGNKKVDTGKIIIKKTGQGCLVPPADMMGWWTGDGTANDRFDGNHGTLLNGATYADGKVGQAFLLDGVDDTVQVSETMGGASLDGYGQLTLDAWVKPDTLTPAYQTIVSKYDGSQDDGVSYWLGIRPGGRIQFSVYSDYTASPFTSTGWTAETVGTWVPTGTFTHVAGVWKGGADLKIYINGYELTPAEAPVVPNANGPGGLTITSNTAPMTIGSVWREGSGSTVPGLLYKGLIDEVEIFDRALSAGEVKSISDAGSSGKCKVDFPFTAGPAPLGPFGLTLGGQKVFDPVPAGSYTVQEIPVPSKWKLTGLVCDDSTGGTSVNLATGTATIGLAGGDVVTCTYTNEKENKGKIIINKVGTPTDCTPAPAGMNGWWPGNENTKDLVDGNDGTLVGDATYDTGKVGKAFTLDGTGDAVQIPESGAPLDGFERLTLDAWVNPDTVNSPNPYGLQTIVAKYDYTQDNGYSYWLGLLADGSVRFAVYTGNVGTTWHGYYADTATGAVAEDIFSHVAGVWNGGTDLKIYVNGVLVPAPVITQGSPGTSVTANAIPVSIGRVEKDPFTAQPGLYFQGLIDEVEIFGRALSQAEIQAIVAAGSDGKCKTVFPFTASPSPLGAFSLPLGGQMVFDEVDAGPYTVTETPIPDDWDLTNLVCTDPDLGTTFDTATGIATIDLDAGETVTCTYTNEEEACAGKICGYKYNDLNGDGQMDTGDTGVAGVKMRLYPGTATPVDAVDIGNDQVGNPARETGHNLAGWGLVEPTNSGGNYGGITDTRVAWTPDTPGDARPASFTLAVADTTKDHFMLMKVLDGVADDSFIVLVNGNPVYSFTGKNNPVSGGQNYFGDPASTNVADEKWKTHGIFLAKEILTSGDNLVTVIATGPQWSGFDPYGQLAVDTVEFLKLGAPIAEATTDATGHYCFGDLDAGDYYVGEAVIPSGNIPSTHSILSKVTLACNQEVQPLNFFNTGFLRICGEKYRDTNGNGLPDPGETGLGGVGMTLFTRNTNPVDGVDIGDTTSETGHSLNGWGPIEPLNSGGTWGGIDDARATWVKGDGRGASFTMNAGTGTQHELVLRVLDGQADDSFMVFVNGNPVYQYTAKNSPKPGDGNYFGDPSGSEELWRDHRIYVSGTGTLTISVAAMGDAWSGFDTYGQLGVDRADLYTLTPVSGANPVTTATDGKFCFLLTGMDLSSLPVYYIGETGLPAGSIPTTGSVSDPASRPYIFRNTEVGKVSKLFDLMIDAFCPPGGFEPGDYTTYTQGGWGAPPHGNNPGKLLADNFATVYPSGVVIGRNPNFKLTFTSASAVEAFLPQGGTPGVLTGSATDPTTSAAGVFAGQVLTLQLNVDFSKAGITDPNLKDLKYVDPGDSLDGKTIEEILAIANDVLGGGALPSGYTVSKLNDLVDKINNAFDEGIKVTGWAQQHLKKEGGNCISPLPVGAVLKVDLTRNSQTVTKQMTQAGDHWTADFTGLEPGCYDYRVYYQVDAQPPVTLFQGTECIPVPITNSFTWEGCHALIGIEKDGPVMGRPGDTITYTYDVTNLADEPLANVGISDDLAINERPVTSGGFNVGDTDKDNLLDPGEVWKFEADYVLPTSDPDKTLTNVVTASGNACGKTVTAWDDYTLVLFTLRKNVLLYWDHVEWPYDDPNTEFKVRVLDEAGNPLTGELILTESTTLSFWFRPGIYEFDEFSLPQYYEKGYDSLRKMLPEDGLDWTLFNIITYDLTLTKSGPPCAAPGDQVTFTYTVTNAGPASVAPVLTDNTGTPILTGGDTHNPGFIDPDETWTYTLTVTMPGTPLTNIATVFEPNEPSGWHKGKDRNKADNTATWTVQVCFPGKVCGTKYADTDGNGLNENPEDSGLAGVGITLYTSPGTHVDSIDIGAADEGSHNLQDWSDKIIPGYDGSANCRVAWIGGNGPWASFTLHNAVPGKGHLLVIEALDGIGDDSFTVKAGGRLLYAYAAKNSPLPGDGNYFGDAPSPTGIWHSHGIYVPPDVLSGTDLTVTITATGSPWDGMEQWGQLGVDHVNFYALDAVTLNGNPATTDGDGDYCFEGIDVRGSPSFFAAETSGLNGRVPTTHSVRGPVTLTSASPEDHTVNFRNTEMYEKTFVLTLTNPQYASSGTTYWASLTQSANGQTSTTIQLTGSGTTVSGVISHLAAGTYQYRFYAVTPTGEVTIKEGSESFPPNHDNTAEYEWPCPPGAISGTKYLDANNNGHWDIPELPGEGFTMTLICEGAPGIACVQMIYTDVTDEQGRFEFTGLGPVNYRLYEESKGPGWIQTEPASDYYEIALKCGDPPQEFLFGNYLPPGCTYTQGYWKTHSKYGPAGPRDATWDKILPSAEDSPFFNSGKSWVEILQTPSHGNAYYILAKQYIAAKLNVLNMASSPDDVNTAIAWATAKFAAAPGDQLAPLDEAQALTYATLLDTYNNGDIGPGHCGDETLKGTLTVTKEVQNSNGGTKTVANFPLFVGTTPVTSGVPAEFNAGTYLVSETQQAGYTRVISGDCAADGSITLEVGDNAACTITNSDIPPSLTLDKVVVNLDGGTAVKTDWTLSAAGPTPISGAGGATSGPTFSAGTYTLSESGGPAGYSAGPWICTGDVTNTGNSITLGLGQHASCTITNDDIPPQLTLVKDVINDNGRTDLAETWILSAAGPGGFSGHGVQSLIPELNRAFLGPYPVKANVVYALSEYGEVAYIATSWSCTGFTHGGSQGLNSVTLKPGESVTCTISNDDYDFVGQGDFTKSATAGTTTTYTWTIEKTSQTTQLTLDPGQPASVNYQVTLTPTPHSTSTVTGSVTLQNNLGGVLTIGSISDVLKPGDISVVLTCTIDGSPATIPGPLPAGKTLVCTFTKNIQGTVPTSNQAIAVIDGTTYTVTKPVTAGTTVEVDECVTVDDDKYVPSLGTVCANDLVKTKSYSLTIGPYQTCGQFPFVNTASFDATDTHATGSDSHTVTVTVPCQGCTYTQGYWKTHTKYDDKPHKPKRDSTWDNIQPNEEDSPFYHSGKTYYQVITANDGGREYYKLAHQYIAAKLNIYKGATPTGEVVTAITWAEAKFTAAPADALASGDVAQAITYAALLDDFNNGDIGPGHCGDEIVGMMQSESGEEMLPGGEELGLMGASGPIEETPTPPVEEVTPVEETEVVEATPTPVPEVTEQAVEEVVIDATPTQVPGVTGQVVEEVTTEATPTPVPEVTEELVEEVTTEATPTPVEETPTPSNP